MYSAWKTVYFRCWKTLQCGWITNILKRRMDQNSSTVIWKTHWKLKKERKRKYLKWDNVTRWYRNYNLWKEGWGLIQIHSWKRISTILCYNIYYIIVHLLICPIMYICLTDTISVRPLMPTFAFAIFQKQTIEEQCHAKRINFDNKERTINY